LSETVSARLPRSLVAGLEEEAEARGISLSTLLAEIVAERYGVGLKRGEKPFLPQLRDVVVFFGSLKAEGCPYRREDGLCGQIAFTEEWLKGLEPKPSFIKPVEEDGLKVYRPKAGSLLCGLCQIHSHTGNVFGIGTHNPYEKQS
jgi:hypothetical protein